MEMHTSEEVPSEKSAVPQLKKFGLSLMIFPSWLTRISVRFFWPVPWTSALWLSRRADVGCRPPICFSIVNYRYRSVQMTTKIHRSISQTPVIWASKSARWTRVRVFFGTRMHAIYHRYFDHLDSVIQWKALIHIFIYPSILLIINMSLTVEQSYLLISLSLPPIDMPFFKIDLCEFDDLFNVPNTMDSEYLIHVLKPCQLRFSPTVVWEKLFICEEDGCQPCVLHCIYIYCAVGGSCPQYTAMSESYIVL